MSDIESMLLDNLKNVDEKVDSEKVEKAFANWPSPRKTVNYKSKHINTWTQRDFAIYMEKEYVNIIGEAWDINLFGVIAYLSRIKAKIRDYCGFCDNIVLKAYVEYFYRDWLLYCSNNGIKFWLRFMLNDKPLQLFSSKYNYSDSIQQPLVNNISAHFKNNVTISEIDSCYLLSLEAVVFEYGIVIAANYLLNKNVAIEKNVCDKISKIILHAVKTDKISSIMEKTKTKTCPELIELINAGAILKNLKDNYLISVSM